jgi:nucleotide-binding universal stress UspA family protein
MITIKNLVVATDFSEAADAALAYGRSVARAFGATLHVVHVVEDVFSRAGSVAAGSTNSVIAELYRSLEEAGREQLAQVITDEDRRDLHVKPVVLTASSAGHEIVRYAEACGADLVVMGTHGRGKIASLLLGSVAERVVRLAPCPVLTVRHSRADAPAHNP